jgi:quercetin dioxygenase-like cupin family protein
MRKTLSLALLSAVAAMTAAPSLAQTAATPREYDHQVIVMTDAFPKLEASAGRAFIAHKIALPPGARTPLADRAGRPAITYVIQGEVLEHRVGSAEPIRRELYAAIMGKGGVKHYWENASNAPAELLEVELASDTQP